MFGILVGAGLVVIGTATLIHHRHGFHRTMFGCLMRRLKATDSQKQRLSSLFDETHDRLAPIHERAVAFRRDIADLLGEPTIEPSRLEALESKMFEVLGEGAQVLRDVFVRMHDILEPQQRQQLAEILRRKHRHPCHCHGHRAHY